MSQSTIVRSCQGHFLPPWVEPVSLCPIKTPTQWFEHRYSGTWMLGYGIFDRFISIFVGGAFLFIGKLTTINVQWVWRLPFPDLQWLCQLSNIQFLLKVCSQQDFIFSCSAFDRNPICAYYFNSKSGTLLATLSILYSCREFLSACTTPHPPEIEA